MSHMFRRDVRALTLAGTVALSASITAMAQNIAPAPGDAAPPAPTARPSGGLVILDFKPAMDDLMTMLIQPRHLKLFYAGQASNWTLAAFKLDELRGALTRIGRTIPTYRNVGVDMAVASIFSERMKAVDAAIKSKDLSQFTTAYGEMTQACNDCHVAMEHPFIKITVPGAANYPDQEFHP